jgi:hypothetical protein
MIVGVFFNVMWIAQQLREAFPYEHSFQCRGDYGQIPPISYQRETQRVLTKRPWGVLLEKSVRGLLWPLHAVAGVSASAQKRLTFASPLKMSPETLVYARSA